MGEENMTTYSLRPTGRGWYAIIEHDALGERQIDVLPEPAARARYEELAGEPWEDDSDEATADRPS